MFEKLEIVRMAQSMARYASERQQLVARNIANADTPGFEAKDLPDFATSYASSSNMRHTRAGHISGAIDHMSATPIMVGGSGSPNGNTVSLEGEMVKAVDIKQQHDMALAIYRNTSNVLRSALGQGK